ncbi:MAG: hypothetical protein GY936_20040 [Ignavibacteriae bacterium]|nr:hypothetical protein [Ignavibacteriota bacterium]
MKKLNKKEAKEKLIWFENWKALIPETLDDWKNKLPQELKNKLDKSPESLIALEAFMLDTFSTPEETFDVTNSEILDVIATYIGEVFIENLPDKSAWGVELVKLERPSKEYYFYPYVTREGEFIGFNPYFDLIPNAVYERDGKRLFASFEKQLSVYNELKDEISSDFDVFSNENIPGRGGSCYQYFILIKEDTFKLEEIEKSLNTYFLDRDQDINLYFHDKDRLLLDMGDNYFFHFLMNEEIETEHKEIAQGYDGSKDKSQIESCKRRLEFWGDEDDEGDYLNDHMTILDQVMNIKSLLIFDYRNNLFYDEF